LVLGLPTSGARAQGLEPRLKVTGQATWSSKGVNTAWVYQDEVTATARVTAYYRVFFDAEGNIEDLVEDGAQESSVTASGGGTLATPGFEPQSWSYSGCGTVSIKGEFIPWHGAHGIFYLSFSDPGALSSKNGQCETAGFSSTLNGKWVGESKGRMEFSPGRTSGFVGGEVAFQEQPTQWESYSGNMQGSFSASLEGEPEVEAEIVADPDTYPAWVPAAGADEQTRGNNIVVLLQLISQGRTAKWTISLESSSEPGICLNYPSKKAAKITPDLRIEENEEIAWVDEEGTVAETREMVSQVAVTINCYDYGAFGRLSATADTDDGRTVVAYVKDQPGGRSLSIPCDDNNNQVADQWETSENIKGDNFAPEEDCATVPSGQASGGDGISLYERYRGFKTSKGWVRLSPREKHVFVRDADGLLLSTMLHPNSKGRCLPDVTKCKVLFIDANQWTGPGPFAVDRIVNFNTSGFGHAVDQHALHLQVNDESSPMTPAAWRNYYNQDQPAGQQVSGAIDSFVLGQTYPCLDAAPDAKDSPATTYKCVVFRGNFINQALDMVRYHTRDLPEFRQYTDQVAWWAMTPEDQNLAWKLIDDAAQEYLAQHSAEYADWLPRMVGMVTTHELCHGLGTKDHKEVNDGSIYCVMRYFETGSFRTGDFPRTASDRFELGLRKAWPGSLCRGGNGQPGDACWKAVRVSDAP
jgi:hypothetical protein